MEETGKDKVGGRGEEKYGVSSRVGEGRRRRKGIRDGWELVTPDRCAFDNQVFVRFLTGGGKAGGASHIFGLRNMWIVQMVTFPWLRL